MCFSTAGVSPTVWEGLALLSPAGEAPTCPTWAVSPASVAAASQGKVSLRAGQRSPASIAACAGRLSGRRQGPRPPLLHLSCSKHSITWSVPPPASAPAPPTGTWAATRPRTSESFMFNGTFVGKTNRKYVSQICQSNLSVNCLSTCWVFCVVLQPPFD